jgi:G3E family GTPase
MNLKQLCPRDGPVDAETAVVQLMRTVLMRTQFVPVVRHVIGWRGLKHHTGPTDGWTARIKDRAGVYALRLDTARTDGRWARGLYTLSYFPAPTEELVEACSLQAAAFTQDGDYLSRVRDFLHQPDFSALFDIAGIEVGLNWPQQAVDLALVSLTRQQVVSRDGIRLIKDGRSVELVAPGACDQDFPAYAIALAFFHVLAASITFNLAAPPEGAVFFQGTGMQTVCDADGFHRRPCADVQGVRLLLGYGRAPGPATRWVEADLTDTAEGHRWHTVDLPPEFQEALWWKAHTLSDCKSLDKTVLGVDDRSAMLILSGFLGSGKTSFLQNFIEYQVQRSRFVAVIQNEIGDIGLDGKTLDYAVTEIDEGCVCCSLTGSLKQAVRRILADFQPDCIILETTGLANPFNLLEEMDELAELVRFDSVTTVVDAVDALQTLVQQPIAVDQVRAADVLLLNKQDRVSPLRLKQTRAQLRRLNPRAPIFCTTRGDVHPALIYDLEGAGGGRTRPGTCNGSGTPDHAGQGMWTRTVRLDRPLAHSDFLRAVDGLPPSVLRAKGIVDLTQPDQTVLFHYVAGRYDLTEFKNPGVPDRFLVFIGQAADQTIGLAPFVPPFTPDGRHS